MVKIHTRVKRKLRTYGRSRPVRPKTFKTAEAANAYAKENKITKFKLVNINLNDLKPKLKIVKL